MPTPAGMLSDLKSHCSPRPDSNRHAVIDGMNVHITLHPKGFQRTVSATRDLAIDGSCSDSARASEAFTALEHECSGGHHFAANRDLGRHRGVLSRLLQIIDSNIEVVVPQRNY